ncbi:MAG: glycoside hydrolase family 92 protein [Parabacteroides distasonis]|nr:glycoside hydrolase family 92 protein [Parabacteroides distasonis]MBQ4162739.1 GH92 family glycosyl hydrolase [Parabacteroides sp.]
MQKQMKSVIIALAACMAIPAMAQKTDLVNPIIGTNGMGHTFPGACAPFGIVQVSPDTDTIPHNIDGVYQPRVYEYCAGYQHKDSSIVGFSHTHFNGTGHSDLGDILLMPYTGETQLNPGTAENPDSGYRSRFSHDTEVARPGYYEVLLADDQIKVQLTATQRTGIHKYTYPTNQTKKVILDLNHGIYNYDGKVLWANLRVENDTLITGYRITNGWSRVNYTYFAISFSQPIKNYGYKDFGPILYGGGLRRFPHEQNFPEIGGRKVISYFEFEEGAKPLEVKVALSAVGTDGAIKNLQAEASGKSFDAICKQANDQWEKAMAVIDAEGNEDQMTMLYTSLYHTMINPSVYMDVDGRYRGLDHNIHQSNDFTNYTVFSVWDTYRALHPLFNIIKRKESVDIIKSMITHYKQSVHNMLPIWSHMGNENWCMRSYHSVSVLADAITKGLPIDKKEALEAMISTSNVPYFDYTAEYKKYGYIPFECSKSSSASTTLENAFEDWAVYTTASKMGEKEVAETYKKRALSYQNLFKPGLGFACPRFKDGSWKEDLDILETHHQGFLEGNSWNYSFYVPQAPANLIKLMGGDRSFVNKLDSLFTMHLPDKFFEHTEDVSREGLLGTYGHGNEPSQHIPYLYAWSSQPWKTQYWVREIMNKMYRNNIDGLCGNDDCGQMSAWYIFTAMGFYPVCPGSDQYIIGAPYLPYMKLNLENGKTFEIKAPKVSDKNRYIKAVKLNGKAYNKAYITHDDIMNGGELVFEMASKPNKGRKLEKPYSLVD